MSGFEILIILLFIIIPIVQAVSGKGRTGTGPPRPPQTPRSRPSAGTRDSGRGWSGAAPGQDPGSPAELPSAADMVPDDLWAILTGERRPGARGPAAPSPWSGEHEPGTATSAPGESWGEEVAGVPTPMPPGERREDELAAPGRGVRGEAISLEYMGPEAISLETLPAPPEVRQAAFHARLHDGSHPRLSRHPRGVLRHTLRQPAGLRRAVMLAEILGPPRGA